jgi:flagellar biosynthesis protein FliQ
VDAFPKDVRSSAQGLFNLLILGVGNMVASYVFPNLIAALTGADGKVDYQTLFYVPTGLALLGALVLPLPFTHPRSHRPVSGGYLMASHGSPRPFGGPWRGGLPPPPAWAAAAQPFFKRINKPIGIQLYTLGEAAQKDLSGTLPSGRHRLQGFELPASMAAAPRICAPRATRRASSSARST